MDSTNNTPVPPEGAAGGWLNAPRLRPMHVWFKRLRTPLLILGLVPYLYYARGVPLWPGLVALALGELIQLWAAANLEKQTVLSVSGPYLLMRNPMYVGRFLVAVGFSLMVCYRWAALVAVVVVFLPYASARVAREEPTLLAIFGDAYAAYCARVRRWWPRLPAKGEPWLSWSWRKVLVNHQLRFTAALVATVVLVVLRRHFW